MFVKHLCPFPQHMIIGLLFDHDLLPTDLNINRDHLLIMDYLPTKFEASGTKPFELSSTQGVEDQHDL